MTYGSPVRDELRKPTRELRRAIRHVYEGYKQLHDTALAEGDLDAKTKELIALAIAVTRECDGCIAAHAHAAVRHGATPQEAAEAIGVAILMNGGPGTVYGPRAYAAVREFHADPAPTAAAHVEPHARVDRCKTCGRTIRGPAPHVRCGSWAISRERKGPIAPETLIPRRVYLFRGADRRAPPRPRR